MKAVITSFNRSLGTCQARTENDFAVSFAVVDGTCLKLNEEVEIDLANVVRLQSVVRLSDGSVVRISLGDGDLHDLRLSSTHATSRPPPWQAKSGSVMWRQILERLGAKAMETRFELYRGAELLGTIELRAELCDFPWYGGQFSAAPAFGAFEHLFREELRLLDAEEMDAWGKVWAQIDGPGLRLVPAGGGVPVAELHIHIENGEARWRC